MKFFRYAHQVEQIYADNSSSMKFYEERDTHQVEQIYVDNLVFFHPHLYNIMIFLSFNYFPKKLLKILPQPSKMCMSTIRFSNNSTIKLIALNLDRGPLWSRSIP